MRTASPGLKAKIVHFEANRLVVYRDLAGIATGGIGHTGRDLPPVGSPVSEAQADKWFNEDVQTAIVTAYEFVPANILDTLPTLSWDALLSFLFNVGRQAFINPNGTATNFRKALAGGHYVEVGQRMLEWIYAGGKKVNGLIVRRAAESAEWNRGFQLREGSILPIPMVSSITVAKLPEESGCKPEPPTPEKIVPPKLKIAFSTIGAGLASQAAPDSLMTAGSNLRAMVGDVRIMSIIGAVLIAGGIGLMLWHQMQQSKKTGA